MNIGLYNLESKIVNTAMMQVSQYWREHESNVEEYFPLLHHTYDKVYAFSIFSFTNKQYVTDDMVCGGTGFDIMSKLDKPIEDLGYDWSLYPGCDFSILMFSRGCIRKCPYCIVWKKEGGIHPVEPKNLNPNGKYIKIQDNNFFANSGWRLAIQYLKLLKQPVEFAQGVDYRLLDKEQCDSLNSLSHFKQIKIAWDNPREDAIPKLKQILKWIPAYKLMCFVLIGYWSTEEEDLSRVTELNSLGIDPFAMPYNKKNRYQKKFARWVNRKAIFNSVKWGDYR